MKKTLKVLVRTMEVTFIVFFFFLVSLCFRQQLLPSFLVNRLCEKCSSERYIVACNSVSVGFRHGIRFLGIRVYDRMRKDNLRPVVSADSVSAMVFARRVTAVALKFPRLHDAYYAEGPASDAEGGASPFGDFDLSRIPAFTLELVRPEILGVAPERVVVDVVSGEKRIDLGDFRLEWPDQEFRMGLEGGCSFDFGGGHIVGNVRGTARQEHIRPLLQVLDLPSAYPYMGGYPDTGASGFTEVPGPVPVDCSWRYDFAARDFRIDLDLHPDMGRYNGVRMQHVDGKLGVHAYFTDGWFGYDIAVGPLAATDPQGRTLQGELTVHGTNGLDWLEFDASSGLEKQATLDVLGYLNRGTFDALVCDVPPRVTAKGVFNCDDVNIANNDFAGRFEMPSGSVFGQRITDAAMDYRLQGSGIVLTNLTAKGSEGGDVTGWMRFHLPLAADDTAGVWGEGSVETRDGKVSQVPLFLVLTDALAENVPGIDKIVNQSESVCSFTVSNGLFRTDRLIVQGALFCFKISGTYDLAEDEFDMVAHCTILKEDSILGKYLIQPVLWPFTKLLTEFHVSGSKDDPKLRNTSVKFITEMTSDLINKVFD